MLAPFKSTLNTLTARPAWQLAALRIAFFVALTALSAKITIVIPGNPVPITAQTLAVLMAGLALGWREGALSQIIYVGLIAVVGLPIDARGLGRAALLSPTVGYLIAFIPAALIAGFGHRRSILAGLLVSIPAVLVIYLFGTVGVALSRGISWDAALVLSVAPFIFIDCGKALLAVALVKLGAESWVRWG